MYKDVNYSIIYNTRKVGGMSKNRVMITWMLKYSYENVIQPLNKFTKKFITEYLH